VGTGLRIWVVRVCMYLRYRSHICMDSCLGPMFSELYSASPKSKLIVTTPRLQDKHSSPRDLSIERPDIFRRATQLCTRIAKQTVPSISGTLGIIHVLAMNARCFPVHHRGNDDSRNSAEESISIPRGDGVSPGSFMSASYRKRYTDSLQK
jgi:hypothetical protein